MGVKKSWNIPKFEKHVFRKISILDFTVRHCMNRQNVGRPDSMGKAQYTSWATRYGDGYINKYEYVPSSTLNCLYFEEMTEEWLDFIVACRRGIPHKYDIVEGPMADDTIYNYIQNYLDGKISRAAFWELAKFKYPTHQISFHTISALDTLTFVGSEAVYENKK